MNDITALANEASDVMGSGWRRLTVYLQKNVKFQAVAGSQVSIGARHNLRPSGRLLRKRQGKDDAIIAKIHFTE